jgi:hypothetical protein
VFNSALFIFPGENVMIFLMVFFVAGNQRTPQCCARHPMFMVAVVNNKHPRKNRAFKKYPISLDKTEHSHHVG